MVKKAFEREGSMSTTWPWGPWDLVKQASKWRTWWWWKHHIHILPRLIPGPKFLGVKDGDPVEVHPFECQSEVSAWMACGYLGIVVFFFSRWSHLHVMRFPLRADSPKSLADVDIAAHTRFRRACTCSACVLKTACIFLLFGESAACYTLPCYYNSDNFDCCGRSYNPMPMPFTCQPSAMTASLSFILPDAPWRIPSERFAFQTSFFLSTTVDGSEIPNNHLGWKNLVNNGVIYLSTGDRRISEPSTEWIIIGTYWWDAAEDVCIPGASKLRVSFDERCVTVAPKRKRWLKEDGATV